MRLLSVNSDGSVNDQAEITVTIEDQDGRPYDDPVTIQCRLLPAKQRRAFERQATTYVRNPQRGMSRETDWEQATDLSVCWVVLSWSGISGADGAPLPCTDATKVHLPPHVKAQVIAAATTTEAADAPAASFRESA